MRVPISRKAQTGLLLMQVFIRHPGASFTVQELAQQLGIPEPTASKVLQRLARGGVLEGIRGAFGGYCLADGVDIENLSVGHVVETIDGPVVVDWMLAETQDVGTEVARRVAWTLDGIMLTEMAGEI